MRVKLTFEGGYWSALEGVRIFGFTRWRYISDTISREQAECEAKARTYAVAKKLEKVLEL